jgi:hypothetical protein
MSASMSGLPNSGQGRAIYEYTLLDSAYPRACRGRGARTGRDSARKARLTSQFDSAPRQSDPLHAAEQLQQDLNSLVRLHPGVDPSRPYGRERHGARAGAADTWHSRAAQGNAAPGPHGWAVGEPRTNTLHRPEPASEASILAWIGGTDRRGAGKLRRPSRSNSQRVICLRGWMEILPLQRRNSSIDGALTPAGDAGERIQSGFAERLTIRRQERASEAENQRLGVKIVRCCH